MIVSLMLMEIIYIRLTIRKTNLNIIKFGERISSQRNDFAPKHIGMAIYKEIKVDVGKILRQLCQQKGIEIIDAELCLDHVHILISIPPKYSVSQIIGYLKGKSSLMIFDRHANLNTNMGKQEYEMSQDIRR